MKKILFFFTSVVVFVSLFYNQELGVNLSLFASVSWLFLLATTPPVNRTCTFWILSAASLLSIGLFAWYGDFISFAALVISLLLTGFKAFDPKLNVLVFPFYMAFNYISFAFRVFSPQKWLGVHWGGNRLIKTAISYVIIPAIMLAVFIGLYAAASQKFASFFEIEIPFDFKQLAVLTVLGFFLTFNFFFPSVPDLFGKYNTYLKDDFSTTFVETQSAKPLVFDLGLQRRSGEISLVLLNIVLVFFIVTYTIEQFGNKTVGDTLSSDVHESVFVLILSIVMAIVVIMIYFRGLINFDAKSRLLKMLSFIWIGLNLALIITVCIRNATYVSSYGLTFKRIGVFMFLLLSLLGLLATSIKLIKKKTNIFLVNRMVWTGYAVLVLSSCINWSWLVASYNTRHFANPDWAYLDSLPYNKQLLNNIYKKRGIDNQDIVDKVKKEQSSKMLSKKLYFEMIQL